ncbi:MAG: HNH endonuclease [Treponema sp.]|jgi:hypothetical protein|nr:HNH endonuclease [Treponema sp.]
MGRLGIPMHRYTAAEIRFLEKKVAGRSYAELTDMFNRRFGLSFNVAQINSTLGRLGLRNGRDCRFQPGQVSHNKGKTGCCPAGSEKGWFKPGNRPWDYKPVGTERVDKDGYIEVRIRNPSGKPWKNWKAKHRIIWEKAHGKKIPRGHLVIFADGDKRNFAPDNLLLVSRSEHAVMNRWALRFAHGELTKTGKAVADLKMLIAERKRGMKGKPRGRAKRGKAK